MSLCHYCDWINFNKTSLADIKPSRGKPSVTDTASQHALSSPCLLGQPERIFFQNSILLELQTSKWSFTMLLQDTQSYSSSKIFFLLNLLNLSVTKAVFDSSP